MIHIERLISLIDVVIFTQGLVFGLIFLFSNRKEKSTAFLGLFLLAFSFDSCKDVLDVILTESVNFQYELLPTMFIFLALPLFYVYAKQVSVLPDTQQNYWILLPGILEFIGLLVLFILKIDYQETLAFVIYFLLGMAYNVYISIKIIQFARKHLKLVEDQYASVLGLQLFWVKQYTITLLIYLAATFILIGFEVPYAEIMLSLFNLLLIYWIVYKGFVQQNVPLLVTEETESEILSTKIEVTGSNEQEEKELEEVAQKLALYLQETKAFKQKDLTIIDVASAVEISPKKVSKSINCIQKKNFNTYINSLRIEEATLYLQDPQYTSFSVEGIGLEAGFKSKSAFYNAFKKEKNCTPLELRKKMQS